MATYVSLLKFTPQGLLKIHESAQRSLKTKALAKKAGAKVSQILWTLGDYDCVMVFDAPDDAVATGFMLSLVALGNVTSNTLRAFNAAEFAAVAEKSPKL